ncbi:MAG: hypothetical protein JWN38_635 [Candidatus Saccharibacteria bacterium]|nr:hypothetical protein [Candidatus Saccharibacteria bacterium]
MHESPPRYHEKSVHRQDAFDRLKFDDPISKSFRELTTCARALGRFFEGGYEGRIAPGFINAQRGTITNLISYFFADQGAVLQVTIGDRPIPRTDYHATLLEPGDQILARFLQTSHYVDDDVMIGNSTEGYINLIDFGRNLYFDGTVELYLPLD